MNKDQSIKDTKTIGKGTCAIWAGEEEYLIQQATQVPVVHSVSFGYSDVEKWQKVALGDEKGHIYSRNTNPTVEVFENKICRLEGAQAATSAATGMGIISSTLFALLKPGQRVVSVKDTYGGTNRIFTEFLQAVKYSEFTRTFKVDKTGSSYDKLKDAFNSVMADFCKIRSEKEQNRIFF